MKYHPSEVLKKSFCRVWCELLSTWFHCGNFPCARGTVGSLAALPLLLLFFESYALGIAVLIGLFLAGLYAVREYLTYHEGSPDPSEVVIDEVCGQLLVFIVPITLSKNNVVTSAFTENVSVIWCFLCSGVLSFRLFDIVKPWPICVVDGRVKGTLGIMLDDVLAAVFAIVTTLGVVNWRLM